jgi:hypothetical protein
VLKLQSLHSAHQQVRHPVLALWVELDEQQLRGTQLLVQLAIQLKYFRQQLQLEQLVNVQ